MIPSSRTARHLLRAGLTSLACALTLGAAVAVGCSNNQAKCSAPSSGTFTVPLTFSQTLDVALECTGVTADAGTCGARPHAFDGQTWSITVDGTTATVDTGNGAPWSCMATTPQSPPASEADGATAPATGCYLLVTCNLATADDAGAQSVQIQLTTEPTADANDETFVVVHELEGQCCADQYTGAWQQ